MTLTPGLNALKQKDYPTAIAVLIQYCDRHPDPQAVDYYKAQIGLCQAYRATGKIQQALDCCTRLQTSPYPKVQQWAAQQRQTLHRPKPEQALLATLQQAMDQGDYTTVITRLAKTHFPPSSTATTLKCLLIEAYQQNGQREEAIAHCQALLTDPDPKLQQWAHHTLDRLTATSAAPRPNKGWRWLGWVAVLGVVVGGAGRWLPMGMPVTGWSADVASPPPMTVDLPTQSDWQLSQSAQQYTLAFSPAVRSEIIRQSQQGRNANAPQVNEENTYYEIYGQTAADLIQEIPLRSPRMDHYSGKTAIATAALKPSWKYEFVRVGANFCAIATVETIADVVYTFPKWVDYDQADRRLQQRWDIFLNAVTRHEHRHRDILIEALVQVEPAILALEPQPTCEQAVTQANAVMHTLINQSNEKQRHFDATDDHPDYYALRSLMVEEWRDRLP
ncbi:DUF922 domain-containing protein [Spirulina major CS-329]|uniref:DUF922 domain-containing protein n=1 Tax=Spirulina TaxID=1154 RepID=UPI00232BE4EE|nr:MULTISPECIES: DUF922 domain-containing protein [Spirulina]MDB9497020.1 DUF922 domain-containing protein [Spirulina subsalsa CS-330]MDB9505368.1 DUF922 domain-containing protein [Spirulina major CS-329]